MTEEVIFNLLLGGWSIPIYPSVLGSFIIILLIIIIGISLKNFPKSKFSVLIDYMYDGMYLFFEEVLGLGSKGWLKKFVTNMFFVFLLFNLLSVTLDFLSPISGYNLEDGEFFLSGLVAASTATIVFNVIAAIASVLIILYMQFDSMPGNNFFKKSFQLLYEYFPIGGKGILVNEDESSGLLVRFFTKTADIVLSMFIGFLDFIGIFAKVISLSLRLFGNMLSGTILITVLVSGLGAITMKYLNFELAPLVPLILYAQSLLVACIQALVFPLLVAIFVKVATMGDEEVVATV